MTWRHGRRIVTVVGVLCALSVPARPADAQSASRRALLDQYCVACHNARTLTAELALDTVDVDDVTAAPDVWEKVVRKLRAGAMPPLGRPRPDPPAYEAFTAGLEAAIDTIENRIVTAVPEVKHVYIEAQSFTHKAAD
mgnify:CR=1 FL=1